MKDLIVFGEDWGSHPSSTQHLIRHLNQHRKVVWFNSIGLRRPRVCVHDFKRMIAKLISMLSTGNHIPEEPNMDIISPKALPFPDNNMARACNRYLLQSLVKKNSHDAVMLLTLPTAIDAIPHPCTKVIYYCCDDFGALEGVDHYAILKLEAELAQRADKIIITNPTLADKFYAEKVHLIPHGVDYELFASDYSYPDDLPEGSKIVGFYGSISSWFQQEWLAYAALALPDWQFVLIGEIKTDVAALESCENIHFLGAKPHKELAAYVNNWDVSMMPFHDTQQIHHCNPLKLREYMAAGKPIVSSCFPAANTYEYLIYQAFSKEQFVGCLENAMIEDRHLLQARRDMVRGESWERRAQQLNEVIEG